MKVKELIEALNKYNLESRVVLCSHGQCSTEEENEILGCYEQKIYDKDDNIIETVVELYEY